MSDKESEKMMSEVNYEEIKLMTEEQERTLRFELQHFEQHE